MELAKAQKGTRHDEVRLGFFKAHKIKKKNASQIRKETYRIEIQDAY